MNLVCENVENWIWFDIDIKTDINASFLDL